MKLPLQGFSNNTTESDLERLFSKYGTVRYAEIAVDFETDESRGFGFVDMPDDGNAEEAIEKLDGRWWYGSRLKVSKARGD